MQQPTNTETQIIKTFSFKHGLQLITSSWMATYAQWICLMNCWGNWFSPQMCLPYTVMKLFVSLQHQATMTATWQSIITSIITWSNVVSTLKPFDIWRHWYCCQSPLCAESCWANDFAHRGGWQQYLCLQMSNGFRVHTKHENTSNVK